MLSYAGDSTALEISSVPCIYGDISEPASQSYFGITKGDTGLRVFGAPGHNLELPETLELQSSGARAVRAPEP